MKEKEERERERERCREGGEKGLGGDTAMGPLALLLIIANAREREREREIERRERGVGRDGRKGSEDTARGF